MKDNRFWGSKFGGDGIWLKLYDYEKDITCPICSAGKLTIITHHDSPTDYKCEMCHRWFTEAKPADEVEK